MGDILVAQQIMAYEPGKMQGQDKPRLRLTADVGMNLKPGKVKDQFIPRGDRVTASTWLLDKCRSGDLDWHGAKVHFGLVLSGEKLVNDATFRDGLLDLEPEAIGGEMEGAGLYTAASAARVDWILVKGICDWADGNKDDTAQPLAAGNAVRFVQHIIQLGGWEAHTPPAPSTPLPAATAPAIPRREKQAGGNNYQH